MNGCDCIPIKLYFYKPNGTLGMSHGLCSASSCSKGFRDLVQGLPTELARSFSELPFGLSLFLSNLSSFFLSQGSDLCPPALPASSSSFSSSLIPYRHVSPNKIWCTSIPSQYLPLWRHNQHSLYLLQMGLVVSRFCINNEKSETWNNNCHSREKDWLKVKWYTQFKYKIWWKRGRKHDIMEITMTQPPKLWDKLLLCHFLALQSSTL